MRWKCTVAYDGTQFEGWQSQPGGNTIQDFIEARLAVMFERRVVIHGSGRTDSGVHAREQVFHFDADWSHGPDKLIRALRTGYPDSIQVYKAEEVDEDFHARFSVVKKRYTYQFFEGFADPFETRYFWSTGNRRMDVERMNTAGKLLSGKNDFSAFTANPGEERDDDPVKDLSLLRAERIGPRVILAAEADGFLYRMVRSLAGCLFDVGIGKLEPEDVLRIRDSRERKNLVLTAPAEGLFLDRVWY
ncbi:tRNA pseudouridine(38-40) synthase TruA [Puniceicoccales bacterium CK1056]|uniref:tRNA pseudouridine synthase A n=1 Tax=Oceanipulchritudo coccoides TaxID=2706888 RepID=A0A6B2M4L6_9BACT|nr:tRNA pseudouridine(38-40) synthase TruA [Oceanipulchritudo coccoides]NDV63179.1 tRNA pseudouridine(38-40) synthase TruA [Oceanipulchritudo coccoides]